MLRLCSFFAGILISASLSAQQSENDSPEFTFDTIVACDHPEIKGCVLDVGNIPQVERFEVEVPFKNTGRTPLIISDCVSTGGGMFALCPREPIAPGEDGIIRIAYHTKPRSGPFHKPIKIHSNAITNVLTIIVKGNIVPEEPEGIPIEKE